MSNTTTPTEPLNAGGSALSSTPINAREMERLLRSECNLSRRVAKLATTYIKRISNQCDADDGSADDIQREAGTDEIPDTLAESFLRDLVSNSLRKTK